MKIIPLSEGAFTVDKTKAFVPFDKQHDDLQARPLGSLLVEIQPFCVVTEKEIIIIDTGLGFTRNRELQIHSNLRRNNIDPASVTKVLMSHLHKDHSGGISFLSTGNTRELSFSNAKYYVDKNEFAFAMQKGSPSYITVDFAFLETNQQVIFTDGDGFIEDVIEYKVTGAHCPYHRVFWIREKGETIFYGGDVAPQMQQLKNRFVAKYDFDGKKAMELRQQWRDQGIKEGWTFLFYHDIKTPVAKVEG